MRTSLGRRIIFTPQCPTVTFRSAEHLEIGPWTARFHQVKEGLRLLAVALAAISKEDGANIAPS
jgi:hypothetical protein